MSTIVCGVLWAAAPQSLVRRLLEGPQLVSIDPSPKVTFQAREGDTVTGNFIVKNVTDQPLRLLGANTSCGCTVVESNFPVELNAGASTVLKVQMHVEKPTSNGTFQQEAHLLMNREGMVPPLVIEAEFPRTAEGGQ
ncbi:MAG: DUF1573 domain-containing protein [Tepidisphaeraceae bacterium]